MCVSLFSKEIRKSYEKPEPNIMTTLCCHYLLTSTYALCAGRVLTAGGSRAQISIAEATGNAPSATSKE